MFANFVFPRGSPSASSGDPGASSAAAISVVQPPAGSGSSAAVAASSDVAALVGYMPGLAGQCWFECGTTVGLLNIGNARSEKWVCCPCNGARRLLDSSCRGNPAVKAELADMKKNRQSAYKRKVRSARIQPASELANGAAPSGIRTLADRREAVGEFRASVVASLEVSDNGNVHWPLKRQWIKMYKDQEDVDDTVAQAAWTRAYNSYPATHRKDGVDEASTRLAFEGIPFTAGKASRGLKRSADWMMPIEGEDQWNAAARLVSVSAIGRGVTDAEFGEVGGSVFRPNAALPNTQVVAGHVPAARNAPVSALDSVQALMNMPANAGALGSRTLQRHPSDLPARSEAETKRSLFWVWVFLMLRAVWLYSLLDGLFFHQSGAADVLADVIACASTVL